MAWLSSPDGSEGSPPSSLMLLPIEGALIDFFSTASLDDEMGWSSSRRTSSIAVAVDDIFAVVGGNAVVVCRVGRWTYGFSL